MRFKVYNFSINCIINYWSFQEFRIVVWESDVPGGVGLDDDLGEVNFNSNDVDTAGSMTLPVSTGGELRIRKI